MTTTKTDPDRIGRKAFVLATNSGLMSLMLIVLVLAAALALNERRVAEAPGRLAERIQAGQVSTTLLDDLDTDLTAATSMPTSTPTSLTIPLRGRRVVRYEVMEGALDGPSLVVRYGVRRANGTLRFTANRTAVATHLVHPGAVFSAPLPIAHRLRVDVGRGATAHDVQAGLLYTP